MGTRLYIENDLNLCKNLIGYYEDKLNLMQFINDLKVSINTTETQMQLNAQDYERVTYIDKTQEEERQKLYFDQLIKESQDRSDKLNLMIK